MNTSLVSNTTTTHLPLVAQEEFTPSQKQYIEGLHHSLHTLGDVAPIMLGILDIQSKIMAATENYAELYGCNSDFMENKHYHELPSERTQYAHLWIMNNKKVLATSDPNIARLNLGIPGFSIKSHTFEAFECHKLPIYHEESSSILGIFLRVNAVTFNEQHDLLMRYIERLGLTGTLDISISNPEQVSTGMSLIEQEFCFLLLSGYDMQEITNILHKKTVSCRAQKLSLHALVHLRDALCQRFDIIATNKNLCDYLIFKKLHLELPISLYADRDVSVLM